MATKLHRGRRLRLETPGGGGYGSAHERDPEAVARDVRLGYVGRDSARRDYQVAIERDGQIDALETQQLRHQVAE